MLEWSNEQELLVEHFVKQPHGAINASGTGEGKTVVGVEVAARRGARRVLILGKSDTFSHWAATCKRRAGVDLLMCDSSRKNSEHVSMARDGSEGWFFMSRAWFGLVSNEKIPSLDRSRKPRFEKLIVSTVDAIPSGAVQEGFDYNGDPVYIVEDIKTFYSYSLGKDITYLAKRVVYEKSINHPGKYTKSESKAVLRDVYKTGFFEGVFDVVIFDECQLVASGKTLAAKALASIPASYRLLQSADPIGGQLDNWYNIIKLTSPDVLHGMNKQEFCSAWFGKTVTFLGNRRIEKYDRELYPGLLYKSVPQYGFARTLDPANVTSDEIFVALRGNQSKQFFEVANRIAVDYASQPDLVYSDTYPKRLLLEAILHGTVEGSVDDDGVNKYSFMTGAGFESAKADAFLKLMGEKGFPKFLVQVTRLEFANALVDYLNRKLKSLGFYSVAYVGGLSGSEKEKIQADFIADSNFKVIVGTQALSTGIDGLHKVCYNIARFLLFDKALENTQLIGRLARRNQEHPVCVYDIVAKEQSLPLSGKVEISFETIKKYRIEKHLKTFNTSLGRG